MFEGGGVIIFVVNGLRILLRLVANLSFFIHGETPAVPRPIDALRWLPTDARYNGSCLSVVVVVVPRCFVLVVVVYLYGTECIFSAVSSFQSARGRVFRVTGVSATQPSIFLFMASNSCLPLGGLIRDALLLI